MISKRRRVLLAGLGLVALWGATQAGRHYRIAHPDRNHTMTDLLKDNQAFCVGRFLIDLPSGSVIIGASGSGAGAQFDVEYPVTRQEFERRMADRWADLEKRTADIYGTRYAEPSKRLQPLPNAFLFNYEHVLLSGPDVYGIARDRVHHETEGYLWRESNLYSFRDHQVDSLVLDSMRALQVRDERQMPAGQGFCGPRSFFAGGTKPEAISIMFRLPGKPEMAFHLDTTTWANVDGLEGPVLSTPPRPNVAMYESENFKGMTHRDAPRRIEGFDGHEWIDGATERSPRGSKTSIRASWFYKGEPSSSSKPAIHARLEISYETAELPSPWGGFPAKNEAVRIGNEEFMTYWDTILGTLRLRPGALMPGEK